MTRSNLATAAAAAFLFAAATGPALSQSFLDSADWAQTDFSKRSVALDEIVPGGPGKNDIPAIDAPRFVAVSEEDSLDDTEPVIGLSIDGDARAYPLRILIWHEIVNDTVAGRPVAVTYCPLCNSALVFSRVAAGRTLDFGTTGLLRNSDLVMYDRQTQSWWQQFTGEAIVGAMTGTRLDMVPARLESFGLFRERHPRGRVLVPADPALRPYGSNPYVGYDSRSGPLPLFRCEFDATVNPMMRVVAVNAGKAPIAVALPLLRKKGIVEIGDTILTWTGGQRSSLDTATMSEGRDVGNVVVQRRTAGGLEDVAYDVTFAFAFKAFHPEAPIRSD